MEECLLSRSLPSHPFNIHRKIQVCITKLNCMFFNRNPIVRRKIQSVEPTTDRHTPHAHTHVHCTGTQDIFEQKLQKESRVRPVRSVLLFRPFVFRSNKSGTNVNISTLTLYFVGYYYYICVYRIHSKI